MQDLTGRELVTFSMTLPTANSEPDTHLSVNGKRDELTPPAGVEKVRDYLLPLYRKYGKGGGSPRRVV